MPSRFYRQDDRVASVMIEVNRRLYLRDEPDDISRLPAFRQATALMRELVDTAMGVI